MKLREFLNNTSQEGNHWMGSCHDGEIRKPKKKYSVQIEMW